MQIEQDAKRVHERHTHNAITQMPQITRPEPLHAAAIGQLSENRIDAVAHATQNGTPAMSRLSTGCAERSLQDHADLAQSGLQVGQPLVAIPQEQPSRPRRQVPDDLALMPSGGSQVHLRDDAGPAQPHMQSKAREGLPTGVIFAVAGRVIEAVTARGPRKLADRKRHTIHDGDGGIIEQQRVAHEAPQPLFDRPPVGGLPHPGRASHLRHLRKDMRGVAAEVVEDFLVLTQTQIGAHDFHRDDFALGQLWHRPALAQAFSFRGGWQHLVNQTETCDNTIVQVHGVPPQKRAILLRKVDSMNLSLCKETCTSG